MASKYNPPGSIAATTANKLLCTMSNTTVNYCTQSSVVSDGNIYLLVFVLAQMILGVGATPLLTLGISYIDENVDPTYSPIYMGIIYSATFVGASSGLVITGFFLKTFVEIDIVSSEYFSLIPFCIIDFTFHKLSSVILFFDFLKWR